MLQSQRTALEAHGVFFNAANDQVHFGIGRPAALRLEPNCELRAGRFDIGQIGAFSYLGGGSSVLRSIRSIGRFCAIASNLFTGPVDHPTDFLSAHNMFQGDWSARSPDLAAFGARNAAQLAKSRRLYENAFTGETTKIEIGNDVWVGEGVFIRRGVTIGDGAIIGSRSVVTRDVGPYEIVVGAPARLARLRFEPAIVDALCALRWWDYGLSALDEVDFTDISAALTSIERNISNGAAQLYRPACALIRKDGKVEIETAAPDEKAETALPQATAGPVQHGAT